VNRVSVLYVVAGASAVFWLGPALPVRINGTTSAPLGMYSMRDARDLTRNDWVAVCLQDAIAALGRARGYLSAGTCPSGMTPILKQVVAVAGDDVELLRDVLAVNGQIVDRSQRHSVDSLGRPLEPLTFGPHIVRDGEVWVLGIHRERSWDSRYFGPVPRSSIVGIARPLLTLSLGEPQ
jgi:conjugative transfer signal peptidase TraF